VNISGIIYAVGTVMHVKRTRAVLFFVISILVTCSLFCSFIYLKNDSNVMSIFSLISFVSLPFMVLDRVVAVTLFSNRNK